MAFTYFFRDMQTLNLIIEHALSALKGSRYINIWDAGCAHGPEPYSIAIMFRENMSHFLFRNVNIYASDIDNSDRFGKIISTGVYPEGEIKRIPSEIRQKYFTQTDDPGHYRLVDEIRSRVTFVRHDLLSLKPNRTGFGLVVCKNVLLHFNEKQRGDVIRMFHSALREGGFLITEQTQKMPAEVSGLFQQVVKGGQIFKSVEIGAPMAMENVPS